MEGAGEIKTTDYGKQHKSHRQLKEARTVTADMEINKKMEKKYV